jgi:hypothetical protein
MWDIIISLFYRQACRSSLAGARAESPLGLNVDIPLSLWLCAGHNETKGHGMKKVILVGALTLVSTVALAQSGGIHGSTGGYWTSPYASNSQSHTISPYVDSYGTHVEGSHATNPNNPQFDKYISRGDVNPYTGVVGTPRPRY